MDSAYELVAQTFSFTLFTFYVERILKIKHSMLLLHFGSAKGINEFTSRVQNFSKKVYANVKKVFVFILLIPGQKFV